MLEKVKTTRNNSKNGFCVRMGWVPIVCSRESWAGEQPWVTGGGAGAFAPSPTPAAGQHPSAKQEPGGAQVWILLPQHEKSCKNFMQDKLVADEHDALATTHVLEFLGRSPVAAILSRNFHSPIPTLPFYPPLSMWGPGGGSDLALLGSRVVAFIP